MKDIFRRLPGKPLSDDIKTKIDEIKAHAELLLESIEEFPPHLEAVRYRELAVENLENAVMWAVKCLTY